MNRHRIVPVLDNGILKLIRKGTVKMFPAIVRRENSTVYSRDGQSDHYHVVVAAIGYEPGEEDMIEIDKKY